MKGQTVKLDSAKGIIERVVVEDHGDVISVSRAEEVERAKSEGRRPHTAGFRKTDIVR